MGSSLTREVAAWEETTTREWWRWTCPRQRGMKKWRLWFNHTWKGVWTSSLVVCNGSVGSVENRIRTTGTWEITLKRSTLRDQGLSASYVWSHSSLVLVWECTKEDSIGESIESLNICLPEDKNSNTEFQVYCANANSFVNIFLVLAEVTNRIVRPIFISSDRSSFLLPSPTPFHNNNYRSLLLRFWFWNRFFLVTSITNSIATRRKSHNKETNNLTNERNNKQNKVNSTHATHYN